MGHGGLRAAHDRRAGGGEPVGLCNVQIGTPTAPTTYWIWVASRTSTQVGTVNLTVTLQ